MRLAPVRPRSALLAPSPPRSAGPPGDASRPDRPVPAASATDVDPSRLRKRSPSATAPALSAGALRPQTTPARPSRRHHSHHVSPPPVPDSASPTCWRARGRRRPWRPQDERPTSAGGLLSPPGPPPECVEAPRPFAPISSSSPALAGVAMKRTRHGEDVGLATRLGGRARRSLRMRSWSHRCGARASLAPALHPSKRWSLRGRPPRSATKARDERRGTLHDVLSPGDAPRETWLRGTRPAADRRRSLLCPTARRGGGGTARGDGDRAEVAGSSSQGGTLPLDRTGGRVFFHFFLHSSFYSLFCSFFYFFLYFSCCFFFYFYVFFYSFSSPSSSSSTCSSTSSSTTSTSTT